MIADWDEKKREIVKNQTTINKIASVDQIASTMVFVSKNEYIADSIINMTAGQVNIE